MLRCIHCGTEFPVYPLRSNCEKCGGTVEFLADLPDASKLKKQLEYASRKQIPYVVLIGKDEMENGLITVKDMASGEQNRMSREEFIRRLKNKS